MKADLPLNEVENISIAIVLEGESVESNDWQVYLINEKEVTLQHVMVSSKGYGLKEEKEVETSVLRHFVGDVEANEYARIEPIDQQVFGLTNEYWLSYYIDGVMYDKKYIFLPESVISEHLVQIPILDKPGILIGGMIKKD